MKGTVQKQKKVLLKELGSEAELEKAFSVADDPASTAWRGRAAQLQALQRQVKDLREQLRGDELRPGKENHDDASVRNAIGKEAEERRQLLERQAQELTTLKEESQQLRLREHASKARTQVLEAQVRELKGNMQTLLSKGENDDAAIMALRKHLDNMKHRREDSDAVRELEERVSEQEYQIARQSHIILQLRQKTIQQSVADGKQPVRAVDLDRGPSEESQRVRLLEVENQRLREHVKLLEVERDKEANTRPASAESAVALKDKCSKCSQMQRTIQILRQQVREREEALGELAAQLSATTAAWEEEQGVAQQAVEQAETLKRELDLSRAS